MICSRMRLKRMATRMSCKSKMYITERKRESTGSLIASKAVLDLATLLILIHPVPHVSIIVKDLVWSRSPHCESKYFNLFNLAHSWAPWKERRQETLAFGRAKWYVEPNPFLISFNHYDICPFSEYDV